MKKFLSLFAVLALLLASASPAHARHFGFGRFGGFGFGGPFGGLLGGGLFGNGLGFGGSPVIIQQTPVLTGGFNSGFVGGSAGFVGGGFNSGFVGGSVGGYGLGAVQQPSVIVVPSGGYGGFGGLGGFPLFGGGFGGFGGPFFHHHH